MRKFIRTLLGITITIVIVAAGSANASADPLPVNWNVLNAINSGIFPEVSPPGSNIPCEPSEIHPNPVILINPTFANQALVFQAGSPYLKNAGYCVFTFNFGNLPYTSETPIQGLDDIKLGAKKLAEVVQETLKRTRARKVDLVGHSQGGGILPAYYINKLAGNKYVDKFVGISPSNHGTSLSTLGLLQPTLSPVGPGVVQILRSLTPALTQQAIGSDLANDVFGGGDTRPGVTYTTIVTRYDQVVTPYTTQFLNGDKVTNITLQSECAKDWSEHIGTAYNRRAWNYVLNALDPAHSNPVACELVAPYFGSDPPAWLYDMHELNRLSNKQPTP